MKAALRIIPAGITKGEWNRLNDKSLRVLEFNKILEEIKRFTYTNAGKDVIDVLKPYDNIYEVKEHLEETYEALKLLNT